MGSGVGCIHHDHHKLQHTKIPEVPVVWILLIQEAPVVQLLTKAQIHQISLCVNRLLQDVVLTLRHDDISTPKTKSLK